MMEAKLIAKGVSEGLSKENLEFFARLDNFNGKQNVFRNIVGALDIKELKDLNWQDFYIPLAEILEEEGKNRWGYTQAAAQKVALKILETLDKNEYPKNQLLTLDQLYEDTIKRLNTAK